MGVRELIGWAKQGDIMAAMQSRIRWKPTLVLAICVADAAGIYAAHVRLSAPSAASQRADAVAYGAPTQQFTFHPEASPDASFAKAVPIAAPQLAKAETPAPAVAAPKATLDAVEPVRLAKLVLPEVQLSARKPAVNAPIEARKSAPRVTHAHKTSHHDRAFSAAFPESDGIGVIPDLTFDQQVEIAEGKADPAMEMPAMASLDPTDRQASVGQVSSELPALVSDSQSDPVASAQTAN